MPAAGFVLQAPVTLQPGAFSGRGSTPSLHARKARVTGGAPGGALGLDE